MKLGDKWWYDDAMKHLDNQMVVMQHTRGIAHAVRYVKDTIERAEPNRGFELSDYIKMTKFVVNQEN